MPLAVGPASAGRSVNWRLTIPLLVVVVAYVILGAAIFYFLEEPARRTYESAKKKVLREFTESYPEVTHDRVLELLNNFSREVYLSLEEAHKYDLTKVTTDDDPGWDFGTAVYFVVTVITTIGYGDVVPVSSEGRIFCCVYAIIGIPTCLVLLANVGGALYIVIKRMDDRIDCLRHHPRRAKAVRCAALFAIGLCFFVLLPSYMFSVVESWSFANSVYYAFITLSTVGLGDFVADIGRGRRGTPWYLFVLVIWLFLGLAWLSTTVNSTQELITELLREERTVSSTKGSGHQAASRPTGHRPSLGGLTGTSGGAKTISQRSLDSNFTLETTVSEVPSSPYLYEGPQGAPPRGSPPLRHARSFHSIRDMRELDTYSYGKELPLRSLLTSQGILTDSPNLHDDLPAMEFDDRTAAGRPTRQDKAVQVTLLPSGLINQLYHNAVHTPTGVAKIFPLVDKQRSSPEATNADHKNDIPQVGGIFVQTNAQSQTS